MILVTVGTEKFPFNRLMQWIDRLIETKFIDLDQEELVIQYGSCTFWPQGGQSYSLLPETDFQHLLEKARLIISHCGEGSLDLLASLHKPFVLVPRSHQFGEHVDNHQVELAESLAAYQVAIAYSPGDLVRFLQAPQTVEMVVSPRTGYAQISQRLETEFELTSKGKNLPSFSWTHWLNPLGAMRGFVSRLVPYSSLGG